MITIGIRTVRRLGAVALVVAGLVMLAGCGDTAGSSTGAAAPDSTGAASTQTALRVAYAPTAAFLPAFVAQDEGIFRRNGLSVKLTAVQNLSTGVPALGRQFDISGGTPVDVIKAQDSGLPTVAVSGNTVETPSKAQLALVTTKTSGIVDYKDLVGKRIGTPSVVGATHMATLQALKVAGVDPNDVHWIEVAFPDMADQLKAGNVDAVEVVQPFAGGMLKAGDVSIGDPLLKINNPVTFTIWMSTRTWADAHSSELARWKRSLKEAATYIARHDSASRKILEKYTQLPPAVVKSIPLPSYTTDLPVNDIRHWVDAVKDSGALKGTVDPSRVVFR